MSFLKISPLRSLPLLSLVLLAACAQAPVQPTPNEGRDSTQKDALRQAQGSSTARAPSQINLGFGNQEGLRAITPASAEQAPAAQADHSVAELAEPKTFLGTLSCPPQGGICEPYKISVTLAPAGQWRLRATPLGAGQSYHKGGCWVPIGTQPTRIALLADNDSTLADLSFVNNNVLRVNTFNQQRPTLESHLTRQADLDPVSELDSQPIPACR
ncbi:hypothetical protein [Alcaligenes ammonioxydans]|uniref:Lipoprotein n=1 Tax=Alcaligenes ammonioxydans TaxID=2582914 RepID=A0ABX8SYI0_9BURK|nr:hypothetical protein [Alcaligenes ammonioxydans]QXX80172.1 hypothetical protein FE795_14870 [Alcaligenes ammonioxydans]